MIVVSVVIVSFNTRELLDRCLESIYHCTDHVEYEIFVVDNASVDGSKRYITEKFRDVKWIDSGENLGFGRANNLCANLVNGRYVLFLNPDTVLLNNAIKFLSDCLDRNRKVWICGGALYDQNIKPATSFYQIMPGLLSEVDGGIRGIYSRIKYGNGVRFNYSRQEKIIHGYISGADMMIRKDILDRVGWFDPDFFLYYEDTELVWRIKKAGGLSMSVPAAKIMHIEGGAESVKENTVRRMVWSKFLYYYKTNNKWLIYFSHHFLMAQYRLSLIKSRVTGKMLNLDKIQKIRRIEREEFLEFKIAIQSGEFYNRK